MYDRLHGMRVMAYYLEALLHDTAPEINASGIFYKTMHVLHRSELQLGVLLDPLFCVTLFSNCFRFNYPDFSISILNIYIHTCNDVKKKSCYLNSLLFVQTRN